jgi:hypothetical protein
MKSKAIIFLLFIITQSFKCQVNKNLKSNAKERFDIIKFDNQKTRNDFFETTKDSISRMIETKDGFYKYSNALNSPYQIKKAYFKENYNLKLEKTTFYQVPTGIYKVYDKKGKLTKEENLDVYSFSIPDLINKLKNEFDIDLLNPKGKGVAIGGESNKSIYIIDVLLFPYADKGGSREIEIDATTGQLISDKTFKYKE